METNILMESGTNELEVLEFTIGKNHYGINVAKIKEILSYPTRDTSFGMEMLIHILMLKVFLCQEI